MELIWLPEARDDVRRLLEFLLEANPRAAELAVRAIQAGAKSLAEQPAIGRPMGDGSPRRQLIIPFGAAAYVLRYRIEGNFVVVVRVWHGRELGA